MDKFPAFQLQLISTCSSQRQGEHEEKSWGWNAGKLKPKRGYLSASAGIWVRSIQELNMESISPVFRLKHHALGWREEKTLIYVVEVKTTWKTLFYIQGENHCNLCVEFNYQSLHLFRFLWWTRSSWSCGCLRSRSHGCDLWRAASLPCGPVLWWCVRCFTSSKLSSPWTTPPTAPLWVCITVCLMDN